MRTKCPLVNVLRMEMIAYVLMGEMASDRNKMVEKGFVANPFIWDMGRMAFQIWLGYIWFYILCQFFKVPLAFHIIFH